MARVLDLCLQPLTFDDDAPRLPAAEAHLPQVIDDAADFEAFYERFLGALREAAGCGAQWLAEAGKRWETILPCPWFSTTLAGCLDNAADYTTGSALHNPSAIALVGFATVVDSLQAIRQAVFEDGLLTLAQLRGALADDWEGHDSLRTRLIALPKFGHAEPSADELAARLARDVAAVARDLRNERGGHFQPSFFVYYAFQWMGEDTRATPDGRRAGSYLSQGVSPSRLRPPASLTDVFRSLGQIDFVDFPGNSVLDVQLPLGRGMTPQKLSAAIRTFARLGGPTLQLNCVSVEELKDAQAHPEHHQDLVVRIAGLSAKFVALTPKVQEEIIDRAVIG
jgi:formate C-acetyltransferase